MPKGYRRIKDPKYTGLMAVCQGERGFSADLKDGTTVWVQKNKPNPYLEVISTGGYSWQARTPDRRMFSDQRRVTYLSMDAAKAAAEIWIDKHNKQSGKEDKVHT